MLDDRPRPPTKQRILDAALDMFAEEGFGGTTISEIERRVGLAAGTGSLYRHFRSKEELLQAAVEKELVRLKAEIQSDRSAHPPLSMEPDRLALAYRQTLADIRRFDRLFRLMLSERDRFPEVQRAMTSAFQAAGMYSDWGDSGFGAVMVAALGGYHLMGLMQGRDFFGIPEEAFIATLVDMTVAKVRADRAPESR